MGNTTKIILIIALVLIIGAAALWYTAKKAPSKYHMGTGGDCGCAKPMEEQLAFTAGKVPNIKR